MLAPAKLNLYLQMTSRRDDGYHLLDSLVIFLDVGDEIAVKPSETLSLTVDGEFSRGLVSDDNLILRAARLFQKHYDIASGATIHLTKHLPVGAGLGGGSSDAAATLRLLNDLWRVQATLEELAELALPLGADLPACIYAQPLHMAGIGDIIMPMPDYRLHDTILLINPRVEALTADVYQQFAKDAHYSEPIADTQRGNLSDHGNDLEASAIVICPIIQSVLEALRQQSGCKLARMAGSGATCFGLFDGLQQAELARQAIQSVHPDWWTSIAKQG